MLAKRIQVYGQVQGVGFRWQACSEARLRGIKGWAHNRPDGSVEVHAEGEASAIAGFIDWLRQGPRGAIVEDLLESDTAIQHYPDFTRG